MIEIPGGFQEDSQKCGSELRDKVQAKRDLLKKAWICTMGVIRILEREGGGRRQPWGLVTYRWQEETEELSDKEGEQSWVGGGELGRGSERPHEVIHMVVRFCRAVKGCAG